MISYSEDTIAAISTPPGEGGIAVVRISGKSSKSIADRIFHGKTKPSGAESHTVHFGKIIDPANSELVDEVLLTVMSAPNSYTAEDVIEISSHGGQLVAKKILDLCLKAGARNALPGEFTQRAFLNGRIDLAQAEAVADMISAKTDMSLKSAAQQLGGNISQTVTSLGEKLRNLLALLEAYTDFPEEEMGQGDVNKLTDDLNEIKEEINRLILSYEEGKILKSGLKIPIVGRPNVGKSSLFNRLLDESRTIVTEIPGTTRDTVSEFINMAGIPVELIDTAGIRQTGDVVEVEGIKRARREIENADLLLALVDMTDTEILDDIKSLIEALGSANYILLANKADLIDQNMLEARKISLAEYNPLSISAETGMGLDQLRDLIIHSAGISKRTGIKDETVITNVRHRDALRKGLEYLDKVEKGIAEKASYEFLAFDLKHAISALEEIIGKTTPEDILNKIFSQFCIGK
ncbi:MAG: tRNA uridine-5-carboxymethylaminomethyl(34) synthesis GTPase MnmE [candidate division Zixibacteria bacterium]|nr:tRNA uridine-5-carboxymethylaminomethyl(34) synthesis GTPase MnmE [candidate division Zixibacteria bacterium]